MSHFDDRADMNNSTVVGNRHDYPSATRGGALEANVKDFGDQSNMFREFCA